jgi:hypothetical protein
MREELFSLMHIDLHHNLSFSYFLFSQVNYVDCFLEVVQDMINDVPLRRYKNPSDRLIFNLQSLLQRS